MISLLGRVFLVSWLIASPVFGKDKSKSTSQSTSNPNSPKQSKVLFTTRKKEPDKAEKKAAFADYGVPPGQERAYVAEYRVPVSLGGSNSYPNIEVLPKNQAQMKHKVQKDLEKKLQRGEISEDEAQRRILNWNQEPTTRD
jgi:hypothetical protein